MNTLVKDAAIHGFLEVWKLLQFVPSVNRLIGTSREKRNNFFEPIDSLLLNNALSKYFKSIKTLKNPPIQVKLESGS